MGGSSGGRRTQLRRCLSAAFVLLIPLALLLVWTSAAPALTVPAIGSIAKPSFAAGGDHSVAVKSDGSLWAWGMNSEGQLGNGPGAGRLSPTRVGAQSGWNTVAAGNASSLGLRSDGLLWAWGANYGGQLGDGTTTSRNTPTGVGGAAWAAVASGWSHTLAIKSDGSLWGWGKNGEGEIGDGSSVDRSAPVRVGTATNWVAAAGGRFHSLGLRSDGSLWAWGSGTFGALGNNSMSGSLVPTRIGTGSDWVAIGASDFFSVGLKANGTLWGWGFNDVGQLGDPSNRHILVPTQIGTASDWTAISVGYAHCVALKADGSLWAWGYNNGGQVGDGSTVTRTTPARVGNASDWVAVAAGLYHSLALKADGSLWAWGYNKNGETGDGTTVNRLTPVQVLTGVKLPSSGTSTTTTKPPSGTTSTTKPPSGTTTTAPSGGATGFSDVSPSHPYAAAIGNMAALGIIGGYQDGSFRADDIVLRKHFAKMIVGAVGLYVTESDWSDSNPPFTDCGRDDPNSLYPHDYIAAAKANGLTSGKTASTFAPDASITRAQMMTMVVRAAQNLDVSLSPVPSGYYGAFDDYSDANHGGNARLAEYNGLLAGIIYGGAPQMWIVGIATRGEVAQILWNLRQKMGLSGGTTTTTTQPATTTTTTQPATTTTTTSASTTTTVPFGQPLYSDDFSAKSGQWPEASDSYRSMTCDTSLSRYVFTIHQANLLVWGWRPVSYSDFTVEVDALCMTPWTPGMYGLVFRVSADGKNMYQFLVSNGGYWEFWRYTNGTRTSLGSKQSNPSDSISQGNAWNHLKVVADGSTIDVYINGFNVCTLTNASLSSGAIGFIAGSTSVGEVQLGFDNFKVWPPEL
jgi:alpha-tubulin suppressor-like RCC1 family protein